jgi:sarcosine oxidase, subunit gamma
MAERRSPLAGAADRLSKVTGAITMAEVPFLTQLNVRRDRDAPAGFPFPTQPCTSVRSGDVDVLWLGPDEWLVVGPPGAAERLTSAVGAEHASIVDVSAQHTTLELGGPAVRDVLAGGCAIDLDPCVFDPGDCVQTELAHAPVVLLRRDPGFWVLVRASYAAHLVEWLLDASVEYTAESAESAESVLSVDV